MKNRQDSPRSLNALFVLLAIGTGMLGGTSCIMHKPLRVVPKGTVSQALENVRPYGPFDENAKPPGRDKAFLEKYTEGPGNKPFWLAHVEFTDYGTLWDPKQLGALERAVQDEMTKSQSQPLFAKGVTVVVYVHGWHHNAKESSRDLKNFRKLLADLSQDKSGGRGVLGVYLSWRGERMVFPFNYALTYWGTKIAAQRIGRVNMPEALARIKNIHRLVATTGHRERSETEMYANSRLIFIGHSFGGAALYSAVSQPLSAKFLEPYWNERRFSQAGGGGTRRPMPLTSGYGDLVLLINPAIEALSYRPLHWAMQSNVSVDYQQQQPVLTMILSGRGDWPNKSMLPVGEFLGNHGDIFSMNSAIGGRGQREPWQMLSALGHYTSFHTHDLTLDKAGDMHLKPNEKFFGSAPGRDDNGEPNLSRTLKHLPMQLDLTEGCGCKKEEHKLLPFMVVQADKDILSGHGGFWQGMNNDRCYNFVKSFISAQNKVVGDVRRGEAPVRLSTKSARIP